jgi:hypothetical protein
VTGVNIARRCGVNVQRQLTSEDIDAASSWEDLQALFARDGYSLEPKASGWVVGNLSGYAKLSALGLRRSAKAMPRFPATGIIGTFKPGRPRRHIPLVDAVDIAKGLAAWGLVSREEVRATISESIEVRNERRRRKQSSDMLDKLIKMHLLAASSLTPPRPRTQQPLPKKTTRPPRYPIGSVPLTRPTTSRHPSLKKPAPQRSEPNPFPRCRRGSR